MDEDDLLDEIRNQAPDAEPTPVPPVSPRRVERPRGIPVWAKIGVVFAVLGGGVAFLLSGTGASQAFVYSKMVDEVMGSPDQFVGRELRVEGQLRQGSIRFVDHPSCEHTFVIERGEEEMPVSFPRCVVPDTFRDDMPVTVVVQGKLQPNGTFLADQVIPRCPSKYDMRERQQNGEAMPHALPPPRS